jgi:hypothetical protein
MTIIVLIWRKIPKFGRRFFRRRDACAVAISVAHPAVVRPAAQSAGRFGEQDELATRHHQQLAEGLKPRVVADGGFVAGRVRHSPLAGG